MQDMPPQNRAQRRAQARGKARRQPAVRVFRTTTTISNPNTVPSQPTAGGDRSADSDDESEGEMAAQTADYDEAPQPRVKDTAPGNRRGGTGAVSHKRGAGRQTRMRDTLVSYYGFAGMLVASRNQADGMLIMGYAEPCADAWIELGKANPAVQRVLEIICVGGPFTAILLIHGKLAMDLMQQHGTSPMALFEQVQKPNTSEPTGAESGGSSGASAPLPYTPAGPMAGTDTVLPSLVPMTEDELRIIPDVGIPSDLDVQLRHAARTTGRPYDELKREAMVLLAQQTAIANGRAQAPGSLGSPVMQE